MTSCSPSAGAGAGLTWPVPAAPPAGSLSSSLIETAAQFAELEAEWNALAARAGPSPMARHDWLMAAAEAYPSRRLAVFLVRDAHGRLRAAAPFAVTAFGPFERLTWLSHEMNEPQTLLYEDRHSLEALWTAIRRAGRPLVARRLTPRDGELELLKRAPAALVSLRPGSTQTAAAPIEDWRRFEAAMSSNSRSEMKRKRRALEKHGAVAFEAVSPDVRDVDGRLDMLLAVEASGWKGRERSAIAFRPALETFLRDYARRTAEQGSLRFFFLTLNGKPIAAQMLVEEDRRLWQFKIGYDEAWARHSPGRLLMFDILRWASDQGLRKVEYLGHGGGWQSRWPVEFTDHATLRFYPLALSSLAALAVDTLEIARRRMDPSRAGDPPLRTAPESTPDQPTVLNHPEPAR